MAHPPTLLARVSLSLTAVAFAAFGLTFLVYPGFLAHAGIEPATPAAATEIRAVYGGLELGLAAFFAYAATQQAWFRPALIAQVLTLGGILVARIFGMLVDASAEPLMLLLASAEAAGALLVLVALLKLPRPPHLDPRGRNPSASHSGPARPGRLVNSGLRSIPPRLLRRVIARKKP